MAYPYYWYWPSYPVTTPRSGPSLADLLMVLLIPLLLVALCFGLAQWKTDRQMRSRGLTRRERRRLAAIEADLRITSPELARRLDNFAAGTAPRPSPRRTETAT